MDEKTIKLHILKSAIVMLISGYLQGNETDAVEQIPGILKEMAKDYDLEIEKVSKELNK